MTVRLAGLIPRTPPASVDEAYEYFDRSISDMLEQAPQSEHWVGGGASKHLASQRRKGRQHITDPSIMNTATKFAGSMQVKAEDIVNLPRFTR